MTLQAFFKSFSTFLNKPSFQFFGKNKSCFSLTQGFSLLLSGLLLFTSIGYYPIFKLRQWQIHEEVKNNLSVHIPLTALECITISSVNENELEWEWEWDMKEFTYRGERYDVVQTISNNNQTAYYCIHDHEENKLCQWMENTATAATEKGTLPLQTTLKKIYKTLSFLSTVHLVSILTGDIRYTSSNNTLQLQHYQSIFLQRLSQPPESAYWSA